jgi:sensor histidine kinase regulating citrate/malate metabolism
LGVVNARESARGLAPNLAYHGARASNEKFNITLERDFGESIAPIELNPQDMTRVLLNLFSNGFYAASQHANSGKQPSFEPTLRVTTRATGDAVEIRIRDNGTGITHDTAIAVRRIPLQAASAHRLEALPNGRNGQTAAVQAGRPGYRRLGLGRK